MTAHTKMSKMLSGEFHVTQRLPFNHFNSWCCHFVGAHLNHLKETTWIGSMNVSRSKFNTWTRLEIAMSKRLFRWIFLAHYIRLIRLLMVFIMLQLFAEKQTVFGIHIALALIYNSKLYTCNVGRCRIILCKTDDSNVLRAVQMSAVSENFDTTYPW